MKVLLDHNIPRQLVPLLVGHEVFTARQMLWDLLRNGILMRAAEEGGFAIMVTGDKGITRQYHNLNRKIALVLVTRTERAIITAHASQICDAISRAMPGSFEVVSMPRRPMRPRR